MSDIYPTDDDLVWLRAALGGTGTGSRLHVLVRPDLDRPELILPLDSNAAAATALHRYHDGKTPSERAMTAAAQLLARAGQLHRAPGEEARIDPFALIEGIAERLGEPEIVAAITLGPRRRNRKPVVQLIRRDGTPLGFAKVGWSPFTRELVANEGHWLRALEGRMPDGLSAPRVILEDAGDERHVVVTSPLPTSIRSYRRGPLAADTVIALARARGTRFLAVAEYPPIDSWRDHPTAEFIEHIDVDRLLERHGAERIELGLWHGDLTRWNTATVGGQTMLWDWEFAADDRPVGFDLLHQEFERIRRHRAHDERAAIDAVLARGPALLSAIGQPPGAVIDLYLCELIVRETRLRGEGWDPTDLGPLDTVAAEMLRKRLG